MKDSDPAKPTLPYPSAATFTTTLDHLNQVGIPNLVDRTAMPPTFSGSSRYEMLGTFKFFGLLDDRALFTRLTHPDTRNETLLALLKSHYHGLFALPLETAGVGQVNKWFTENATPSTAAKARAFFLALAKQAGVKMHPMVAKGARVPAGSVRRKRKKRNGTDGSDPGVVNPPPDSNPDAALGRLAATWELTGNVTARLYVSGDAFGLPKPERDKLFAVIDKIKGSDSSDNASD